MAIEGKYEGLPFSTMAELLLLPVPEKIRLSGPLFSASQNVIAAERGTGKTLHALEWAAAMAKGEVFGVESFKPPKPLDVAYIQMDMPVHGVISRMNDRVKAVGAYPSNLSIVTRWQVKHAQQTVVPFWDEHKDYWLRELKGFDVVFFDTLKKVQPPGEGVGGDSWRAAYWEQSQELRMEMVDTGKCLVWLHHATHDGQVKDTKAIEDDIDCLLIYKDSADGIEETEFLMDFAKDRDNSSSGPINWTIKDYKWSAWTNNDRERDVYDAYNDDKVSMTDLAKKYHLHRNTVSKMIKKERAQRRENYHST